MNVVYVLTNPAMPGLVKIGYSSQEDARLRADQLYTTGVPVPFDIEYVCRVQNADEVERALHIAFGPHRINPRREFFKVEPGQVIAILKLLHTQEATQEVVEQPTSIDSQSVAAGEQLRARRPNLNFVEMGIPLGAELQSTQSSATARVVGPKKVLFDGEETSLTAATRQVLGIEYSVAPAPHWTYQGQSLHEIYEQTYGGE